MFPSPRPASLCCPFQAARQGPRPLTPETDLCGQPQDHTGPPGGPLPPTLHLLPIFNTRSCLASARATVSRVGRVQPRLYPNPTSMPSPGPSLPAPCPQAPNCWGLEVPQ